MSGEDLLKQGQRIWELLDELAANNPEGYKKFVEKQMTDGARELKPPQPVMALHCLTSQDAHRSGDLYVNVCSWQQVPKPQTDSDPIPVKGGILRKCTLDSSPSSSSSSSLPSLKLAPSKGKPAQVFDLAFHPDVTTECCRSPQLEHMLIDLCMDYIEKQAKISLVRSSCRKLKESCIGPKRDIQNSLNEQYKHLVVAKESVEEIKLPSAVSMQDECSSSGRLPDLKVSSNSSTVGSKGCKLIEEIGEGTEELPVFNVTETSDSLVVNIELPKVSSMADADLEITENVLELEVPGVYAANIALPKPVDEDGIKATFVKTTHVLVVTLPLL